ncbi:MAG: FAD-dependent oxidoreductase [bacterium]
MSLQGLAATVKGVYLSSIMQRNLTALGSRKFDLLVVGAGACGAFAAREAAQRGLSVALIERRDFCAATSANSLKVIHGGMRYLQQADLGRVLESARTRRRLMRIAPHLVQPLSCVLPTETRFMRSRVIMGAGLLANDLLSFNRNRGADAAHHIPPGQLISRSELAAIIPGAARLGFTGGALWHDGLAHNTERLVLSVVQSAVLHGAETANYLAATGLLRTGNRVVGVKARDAISGAELEIRADFVINAAGPWVAEWLDGQPSRLTSPPGSLAMGMNFVLRRPLATRHAFALQTASTDGGARRMLFFVPWRNGTLAGTYYRAHHGSSDTLRVTDEDMERFLSDLQRACPAAGLQPEDIAMVQAGLLPAGGPGESGGGEPDLLSHAVFVDHARRDGIAGLLSLVNVKYTTAWNVAAAATAFAVRRLGRGNSAANIPDQPLPGGNITDLDRFLADETDGGALARRLGCHYGTMRHEILALGRTENLLSPLSAGTGVTGAEIVHAVRHEMTQTLCDVVFRRTELGTAGVPPAEALTASAFLMGRELGWSSERTGQELSRARAVIFPGSEFGQRS